jgi:hypothetical protein
MAATLQQILLTPDVYPHVVDDCQRLIEQEVKAKSGVSGAAVKLAYKTANAFASGYLHSVVEGLLPEMVGQLEPYWADFSASGASEFGDYLVKRGDEVAQALLSVTDAKAQASSRATIVKAYGAVRGGAAKNITTSLPAVGALVQRYA